MAHAHRSARDGPDRPPGDEQQGEPVAERRSSLSELGNKLSSLILPLKTLVHADPVSGLRLHLCLHAKLTG